MADGVDIDIYENLEDFTQQEGEFNHHEGIDLYDDVITAPSNEPGDSVAAPKPTQPQADVPTGAWTGKRIALYVGNLTWWTTDQNLTDAITSLGVSDLVEIKFYENRANGQSKGFAVVTLGSDASYKTVMDRLPNKELHGQNPVVTQCNRNALNQFEQQSRKPDQQDTRGPPPVGRGRGGFIPRGPRPPHPQDGPPPPGPPNNHHGHGPPPPHHGPPPPHHGPPPPRPGPPPPHHHQGPPPPRPGPPPPGHLGGPPPGMPPRGPPPPGHGHRPPPPDPRGPPPGHPPRPEWDHRPPAPFHGPPPPNHHPGGPPPPHGGPPPPRPGPPPPAPYPGPPPQVRPPGPPGPPPPHHVHGPPPGGPPPPHNAPPAPHVNPAFFPPPQQPPPAQAPPPAQPDPYGRPPPPVSYPNDPYAHGHRPPPIERELPPPHGDPYRPPPTSYASGDPFDRPAIPESHKSQNGPSRSSSLSNGNMSNTSLHERDRDRDPLAPPAMSEQEFEDILEQNKTIMRSAIDKVVKDARVGKYASAIETLVTAISLIKQSKIANDDRCKICITSLQDTLHGVESKLYGSEVSTRERRSRSWSPRDRERDRDHDRDREKRSSRHRSRSREREKSTRSRDRSDRYHEERSSRHRDGDRDRDRERDSDRYSTSSSSRRH